MQVDFGDQGESEHNLHLVANARYEDDSNRGTITFSNGQMPMTTISHHQPDSNHLLHPSDAGHLAHSFYGDMARTSHSPPASTNTSPRFSAVSPSTRPKQNTSSFTPSDRVAPPRHVSDETIDDAYAAFILYCNPNFATSIDTTELVKLFRMPPKSDGNTFRTWSLFELIRRFDAKEIKTWTQLALELGVKSPDTDKGQSTQKVQQYSVRLKRWMRAMHIDAFFEYLLGKPHSYYLQIPAANNPFPIEGRDGVPLEEDLAIRALDPTLKPKRGRRKAEDGDDDLDLDEGIPSRKRPQLDTSIPFGSALQPQSAFPHSAHPDNFRAFLNSQDPWTASPSAITSSSGMTAASAISRASQKNLTPYSASPMSAQQIRWRLNTQNDPHTPHPLSAVTPSSACPFFGESQSSITPSSSKPRRRRHGPAVSSAWSRNNASSTGKLRGRPPSNRSIRDGPFVTFPVNPKTREGPPIDRSPPSLTSISGRVDSDTPAAESVFRFPPTPASAVSSSKLDGPPSVGPQKQRLSLQVPQNIGNPVRLITPNILVDGESGQPPEINMSPTTMLHGEVHNTPSQDHEQQGEMAHQAFHSNITPSETPVHQRPPMQARPQAQATTAIMPIISPETINRALAAELIRAPLTGRRKRLRGTEAKILASAILHPLFAKPTSRQNATCKVMSDNTLSIAISSCLGLTNVVGIGNGGPSGGVRRVECVRFRVGGDGYESPIDEDDEDVDVVESHEHIKETFDVSFALTFGNLTGEWWVKGLNAASGRRDELALNRSISELESQDHGPKASAAWRAKFLEAQRQLWEAQEEVKKLKDTVLEAVL